MEVTVMATEMRNVVRLATGGALLGGGIGGTLFSLIGTMLVGLQPVVFLACGVYAGAVYGGIVGAVLGTRRAPQVALAVARRQ
jgi:hypothetical protein